MQSMGVGWAPLAKLIANRLYAQARKVTVRWEGDCCVFPWYRGCVVMHSLWIATGVAFICFGLTRPESDRMVFVRIGFVIVAIFVLMWRKAVVLSESGLRQRSWYGGWKVLPWADVTEVQESDRGDVTVRGLHAKIVLSYMHADRRFFLLEVRHYCPRLTAHLINVKPPNSLY